MIIVSLFLYFKDNCHSYYAVATLAREYDQILSTCNRKNQMYLTVDLHRDRCS